VSQASLLALRLGLLITIALAVISISVQFLIDGTEVQAFHEALGC